MKKNIIILTAALVAVLATGCTENRSVSDIKGSYSYKTSGIVMVGSESIDLPSESGQLQIVSLHDGDSILLTMNQLGGGAYCTKGTITKEGDIIFDPYQRRITLVFDTTRLITYPLLEDFDVTVSGTGHYYDDTVVLDLMYDGLSTDSLHDLSTGKITMIAKRN